MVKTVAQGERPQRYLQDPWNRFDFVVVLISYVELAYPLGGLAMLRLVRVLRMLKVQPNLQTIVQRLEVHHNGPNWTTKPMRSQLIAASDAKQRQAVGHAIEMADATLTVDHNRSERRHRGSPTP